MQILQETIHESGAKGERGGGRGVCRQGEVCHQRLQETSIDKQTVCLYLKYISIIYIRYVQEVLTHFIYMVTY